MNRQNDKRFQDAFNLVLKEDYGWSDEQVTDYWLYRKNLEESKALRKERFIPAMAVAVTGVAGITFGAINLVGLTEVARNVCIISSSIVTTGGAVASGISLVKRSPYEDPTFKEVNKEYKRYLKQYKKH